jgi:hypothetical protein
MFSLQSRNAINGLTRFVDYGDQTDALKAGKMLKQRKQ